jgi:type II secretion system protein H
MRERGFTLTELMVVVAIMGSLTAVATPSLARWLTSIRMESATREIASTLQLARVKAITQNTSMRINFDTAANTYQIQQIASANLTPCSANPTPWNNIETAKKLPTGVKLAQVTGNPVTFQSGRGSTCPGTNSTIFLENTQGKTNDVVVAQTGRVIIRKH